MVWDPETIWTFSGRAVSAKNGLLVTFFESGNVAFGDRLVGGGYRIIVFFRAITRIAIALLLLQMSGTFMPLFLLPGITFQDGNFLLPTMEGQYIIKNLMIIAGALVIGGTVYKKERAVLEAISSK